MENNMQQRICDCQLRVGGCYCELEKCNNTVLDSELNNKQLNN